MNFLDALASAILTHSAKKFGVELLHEKTFRDFASGFVLMSIIGASLNVF